MKYLIKNTVENKYFRKDRGSGLTSDTAEAAIYDDKNIEEAQALRIVDKQDDLKVVPLGEIKDEASTINFSTGNFGLNNNSPHHGLGTVAPEHKLELTSDEVSTTNFSTTGPSTGGYVGDTFPHPYYYGWDPNDNLYVASEPKLEVNSDEGKFKEILLSLNSLLDYKNKKYGNAALEPLGIFEGKCKVGQRLDDKLARIKNSEKQLQKNDVADLIGYLTLVCVENGWNNFDEFKD
jgi:hypothetical protein